MRLSSLGALVALSASALAINPYNGQPGAAEVARQTRAAFYNASIVPDIIPEFNPIGALYVTYNCTTVVAGEQFSPSTVFLAPKLRYAASDRRRWTTDKTFLIITVEYEDPSVTNNTQGFILYWLQQDLKASKDGNLTPHANAAAPYVGPDPPENSGVHRYAFLLYEQPKNFTLPPAASDLPSNISDGRIFFNFPAFVNVTNLDEPVAGTFFLAQYDGIPTPTPTFTSSSPSSTPTTFTSPSPSNTSTIVTA